MEPSLSETRLSDNFSTCIYHFLLTGKSLYKGILIFFPILFVFKNIWHYFWFIFVCLTKNINIKYFGLFDVYIKET